jgi:transposase
MARLVWPNPENCSLAELETAMKATPHQRSFVRLQALRALLLGFDHDSVAKLYNVTRDTIVHWIGRFNHRGIDGLIERPRAGRPRKIDPGKNRQFGELVEQPERAGMAHWTAKKFHGYLRAELQQELSYSTVLRWLHEQNFRLKVPQPWPDRQDPAEREAWLRDKLRPLLADPEVDLWYLDEMGVEGDPRPRRRWAKKGLKVRVTHNGDHVRMNVTGLVCPRTGQFYGLEFSHSDREIFECFLAQANADLKLARPRNVLILDNASWHKVAVRHWGAFEPLSLPAYSPDLNPIEELWRVIKEEWFADFVAKDKGALMARLDEALLWAIERREGNQQTCTIKEKL